MKTETSTRSFWMVERRVDGIFSSSIGEYDDEQEAREEAKRMRRLNLAPLATYHPVLHVETLTKIYPA